jgi:hypothetical protein
MATDPPRAGFDRRARCDFRGLNFLSPAETVMSAERVIGALASDYALR